MDLIASVCMSTHYHQVVQSEHGNLSEMYENLNRDLARGINKLRPNWEGVVWEPGELNIVECTTAQAIVEAVGYIIANPVAAGAVYSPRGMAGLRDGSERRRHHGRARALPGVVLDRPDALPRVGGESDEDAAPLWLGGAERRRSARVDRA